MSKDKALKSFPRFNSDAEAEKFVDTADLTAFDMSDFKPAAFEFLPKDTKISMRFAGSFLQHVKAMAAAKGISYQKYIRMAVEDSLAQDMARQDSIAKP